jgi:hypothetical protein
MVTYMAIPKNKLTLGATEFEDTILSARVTRVENGFDTATITLPDTSYYPSIVTESTPVKLEVKETGGAYTTLLKGIVRFPIADISNEKTLILSCLGSGYGLGEMLVATEYGSQSKNPTLDTITEIITEATVGLLTPFVNNILGSGTPSGFSYTASIENINDIIPYINFPYKPALNSLNDLCDLATAAKLGAAGPIWIVTTDDVLRLKTIGTDDADWHKYYGGANNVAGQATLTYGEDYTSINMEKMAPEANYILYYGAWRRPSNGDRWTEPQNNTEAAAMWDSGWASVLTRDAGAATHQINNCSLRATSAGAGQPINAFYPHDQNAAWNFDSFTNFNIPYLNFYIYRHNADIISVSLHENATHYFYYIFTASAPAQDTWFHIKVPIGQYYKVADPNFTWQLALDPVWSNINYVQIMTTDSLANDYFCVDGLYFGDAVVCRAAWNSDLPGGVCKMRLITDNVGKDDSLLASDDSGLMAQYAYSELLRAQKTVMNGSVVTPMIKDALPGQYFNVQGADYRATKIIHTIDSQGYLSNISITDDLTNSRPRARYEDQNKVWASIRPEWQDRQASNIKAGNVDWRIERLVKDYA